jgi:hypothetical protein
MQFKILYLINGRTVWLLMLTALLATGFLRAAESNHLTRQELKTLIASAKTPQDHERIAKHFDAEAVQLDAEATEHKDLAAEYKANPTIQEMKHPMSGQTAGHCQFFADELHKAAQEARQLAADHREMAKESTK